MRSQWIPCLGFIGIVDVACTAYLTADCVLHDLDPQVYQYEQLNREDLSHSPCLNSTLSIFASGGVQGLAGWDRSHPDPVGSNPVLKRRMELHIL